MARPHIVLVAREVWPFMPGGGIGRGVRDTALALASDCDVTVVTSRRYASRLPEVAARPGSWVATPGIAFAWADEPDDDPAPFRSAAHAWSAACRDALAALAAQRPVDLVEFGDYGGAAAVTLQARRSGDPVLGAVPVVVRLHTTWEMSRALDEQPVDDLAGRMLAALERTSLALADALLAPGPSTAAAYRAAYGDDALAPLHEAPLAFRLPPAADAPAPDGPLRVLYVGRLQHLKGADVLVEAVRAIPDADLRLTLVGGDTPTGPGGTSMRDHLTAPAAGDPRVALADPVPSEELPALLRAHDVVVLPSRFEAFGYVLREANAENRPVLAAPVGGLRDGLAEGRGGWAAAGTGAGDLATALADLAADPGRARSLVAAGAPRAVAEEQAARPIAPAYLELARRAGGGAAPRPPGPERLSVVVTATGRDRDLARTVEALRAFGVPLRISAAADAAEAAPATVLDALTALRHVAPGPHALTEARRAALALAQDDEAPLLLLRAGEQPGAPFLAAAARALAADPAAGYATAFTRGTLTGRTPLGNRAGTLIGDGEACATIALFPPGALRPGDIPDAPPGAEDAALYAALAAAGRFGAVVPDPLVQRSHPRVRAPAARPPAGPALRCGAETWRTAGA